MPVLLPLAGVGLFLAGLLFVGKLTLDWLKQTDRATVAIADIECEPPPGQSRADFVGEVQYLAALPERVSLLDSETTRRLVEAFAKHPWVEKVENIEVGSPPSIRVRLVYRTPVLAVPIPGTAPRAVDAGGVLLPRSAPTDGLIVLTGKVSPPTNPPGTSWGDPLVLNAAKTAAVLQPHQKQLRLKEIEWEANELVLRAPGVRLLWGRPAGAEQSGEPVAANKVKRLLEHCRQHGSLDRPAGEHDLRR